MFKKILINFIFSFILTYSLFGYEKTNFGPTYPDKPSLLSISVDTTSGKIILFWKESTEINITKYFIYKEKSESDFLLIDSVYIVPLNNYYIDNNFGIPETKSESYIIQSFNNIGSGNASPYSDMLSSLNSTVSFDSCNAKNTINWTSKYGLWNGITENYFILRSINNSAFNKIATVTGTNNSYTDSNVLPNSTYSYIIQANKENDTLISFSNKITCQTNMAVLPEYINGNYTEVIDEHSLNISFTIDNNSEINHYKLLRSDNINGSFDTIKEYFNFSQHSLIYSDNDITTYKNTYFYKLLGINYCNNIVVQSNISNNIVLNAFEDNFTVSLNWNDYKTWLGDVSEYTVFRSPQNDSNTVSGNSTTYSDDLSNLEYNDINGNFCYYITAKEGTLNPHGITGQSKSNVACVNISSPYKIGNALNPNSNIDENREFKPYISFLPKQYLFLIYDRWGKKVFETNIPAVGWKGTTLSGKKADEGVYIYKIKITSNDNITSKSTGHVTLVYQ